MASCATMPPGMRPSRRSSPPMRTTSPRRSGWCSGRPPALLEGKAPAPELEHLAAHENMALAIHPQAQGGGARDLFALQDLELARQRAPHGKTPAAKIRRGGAGRRVLEHPGTLREEKP